MTTDLRKNIEMAAAMRMRGMTWQTIGDVFKRSAETCRQWPRRHPEVWNGDGVMWYAPESQWSAWMRATVGAPKPAVVIERHAVTLPSATSSPVAPAPVPVVAERQVQLRSMATPSPVVATLPVITPLALMGHDRRSPVSRRRIWAATLAITTFSLGFLLGTLQTSPHVANKQSDKTIVVATAGDDVAPMRTGARQLFHVNHHNEGDILPDLKNIAKCRQPVTAKHLENKWFARLSEEPLGGDWLVYGVIRPVQCLEVNPTLRVLMPILPWKTAERRIGVLGPNWAGKTVLLTSLINHLSSHDPRYFHLGNGRVSAEVRKFRRLAEDRGWPGFDYDQHRERLVHRRWPTKTTDRAQYNCQFERSDWTFRDALLKLYDLPGERINDVAMVKDGSDTYDTWSDAFVKRIEKDIAYSDRFEAYLKRLDDPAISEAEILFSYKVALGHLRLAYKPYITPSTYVLDRLGQAIRGRDPEQLAKERYVGLKLGEEFAPLPREARLKHSRIATVFANRFDAYCDEIVWPLVAGVKSCHSLVILVDVMRILASDTGTHDDYQELLRDMLRALNPRENFFKKGVRWMSEILLPHDWRPGWISRIAFVAPKADLVHPDDRNRLKHLLKQMVERDARDCDGITYEFFNVAAVRATEAVPGGEAKRLLTGSTMLDADGKPIDPGDRQKFIVSALPDEWPRQWKVGDYVFPSVYPEIPARRGCPPEHVGLDQVFNFLCW